MIRLRLPRTYPLRPTAPGLAPGPRLQANRTLALGRRQFLKTIGLVVAFLAAPRSGADRVWARARGRLFTRHQRRTLVALVDRVIPPDDTPGAGAMGAATYIENLLTAFDRRRPRVFARGPFSGRQPFPDTSDGTVSRKRPRNDFKRSLPPTRVQTLRWQAELFGSAMVPEVAALDAQFGAPLPGLRDLYQAGLDNLDRLARARNGAAFADLSPEDQDALLTALEPDDTEFPRDARRGETFFDLVIRHTIEGCFAAPEYGGNRDGAGWELAGFKGDSQPLGYAIFSEASQDYREIPEFPLSTPNPEELGPGGTIIPIPLTADGAALQSLIAALGDIPTCPA